MHGPRFETIAPLVEAGRIKTFGDIFRWISRTRVAEAIHVRPGRLLLMITDPERIEIGEVYRLADLFSLDREEMMALIRRHIPEAKKPGYKVPQLDYGSNVE